MKKSKVFDTVKRILAEVGRNEMLKMGYMVQD